MIYLIEYNRSRGSIVTFRDFDDSQRRAAEDSRLGIELDLNRKGIDHEVVLLEAASKDALHRTHQRYFADLTQILKSAGRQNVEDNKGRESISNNKHRLTQSVLSIVPAPPQRRGGPTLDSTGGQHDG